MGEPVVITIPHKLGKAEARHRVTGGFDGFKAQLAGVGFGNVTHGWSGDRLNFHASALGQAVKGVIDVLDDQLRIELELPARFSPASSTRSQASFSNKAASCSRRNSCVGRYHRPAPCSDRKLSRLFDVSLG